MKYLSGLIAFGVTCEGNSCGVWNYTRGDFTNPDWLTLYESDDSLFGKYGIEENKLVPYHDEELFNVANHVRAYLDMLFDKRFDDLNGLFYTAIKDGESRKKIFDMVYNRMRKLDSFKDVHEFLASEFGNAWVCYASDRLTVDAKINSAAARKAKDVSSR